MQTAPAPITAADLADMSSHWLGCPPNGYLGQSYGSPIRDALMNPMAGGIFNDIIDKFRVDVPLAQRVGPGSINFYAYDQDIDKKGFVFEVAGELVSIPGGDQ